MIKLSHIVFIFAFALIFLGGCVTSTFAKTPDGDQISSVPEKDGDYADPENPKGRVRVFVHHPKDKAVILETLPVCLDPQSESVVGPAGWKLPNSTVIYNINPSSTPGSIGQTNFINSVNGGFVSWNDALASSSAKPNLVRGANTTKARSFYDGLNILAWNRITSNALGITYIRYFPDSGLVVDVDTIMNKRYRWTMNNNSCGDPNAFDAPEVIIHELGHWFGLNDEYSQPFEQNTMFGYADVNEIKKRTLTNGDEIGVREIYP